MDQPAESPTGVKDLWVWKTTRKDLSSSSPLTSSAWKKEESEINFTSDRSWLRIV